LPATGELVCNYDEGFLAGIMETYSKEKYEVKEIDCWSSGAKTCRFTGKTLK
jgi:predicted hydrocarbon binding protein